MSDSGGYTKKEGDTLKKLYVPSPEQKESARHGETLFPMQKYITKLDLVYPVVTTHWHEEAELTLITEGEGLYQIDLVDYEVKKRRYFICSTASSS